MAPAATTTNFAISDFHLKDPSLELSNVDHVTKKARNHEEDFVLRTPPLSFKDTTMGDGFQAANEPDLSDFVIGDEDVEITQEDVHFLDKST